MIYCRFPEPSFDGENWVYRCARCELPELKSRTRYPPEAVGRQCGVPPPLAELWADYRAARARYKAAGSPRVSDDDLRQRLAICAECPSGLRIVYFGRPELARCSGCGCFLAIKSRWATENCPRSHWPGDPPYVEPTCGSCP